MGKSDRDRPLVRNDQVVKYSRFTDDSVLAVSLSEKSITGLLLEFRGSGAAGDPYAGSLGDGFLTKQRTCCDARSGTGKRKVGGSGS
jgi:hypothetical protein